MVKNNRECQKTKHAFGGIESEREERKKEMVEGRDEERARETESIKEGRVKKKIDEKV